MSRMEVSADGRGKTPTQRFAREVRVQMEDGSVETFLIDTRVDQSRLPQVLEGAVRARQRQKKVISGQAKPESGAEGATFSSMMPDSAISAGTNFVKGLGSSVIEAAQGMGEAIQDPVDTVVGAAKTLGDAQSGMPLLNALRQSEGTGVVNTAANAINTIPVVGPRATRLGEDIAQGRGGEGLGRTAGEAFLDVLAAKGLGKMIAGKPKLPYHLQGAGTYNVPPQPVKFPPGRGVRVGIPGTRISVPLQIEVEGPKAATLRKLGAGAQKAGEAVGGGGRVGSELDSSDDKEEDRRKKRDSFRANVGRARSLIFRDDEGADIDTLDN